MSSTPAIPHGRAWSSKRARTCPTKSASSSSLVTVQTHICGRENTKSICFVRTVDTFEEVVDTEDEDNDGSDTIDPGDLQEYVRDELGVLATCMGNGENDAPIPGVDNSQLETACLTLAELPEALAIVQAAPRRASDSNRHSRASHGGKGKSRQPFGRQRVPTDQLRSSEELNDLGHSLNNVKARICKHCWTNEKARSVCHACGQTDHWAGDPQCPGRPVNVIELEDEVQEFEPESRRWEQCLP